MKTIIYLILVLLLNCEENKKQKISVFSTLPFMNSGGSSGSSAQASNTFKTYSPNSNRVGMGIALLGNGKILVYGGTQTTAGNTSLDPNQATNSSTKAVRKVEIFDPVTLKFSDSKATLPGSEPSAFGSGSITLNSGNILYINKATTTEVFEYNYQSDSFTQIAAPTDLSIAPTNWRDGVGYIKMGSKIVFYVTGTNYLYTFDQTSKLFSSKINFTVSPLLNYTAGTFNNTYRPQPVKLNSNEIAISIQSSDITYGVGTRYVIIYNISTGLFSTITDNGSLVNWMNGSYYAVVRHSVVELENGRTLRMAGNFFYHSSVNQCSTSRVYYGGAPYTDAQYSIYNNDLGTSTSQRILPHSTDKTYLGGLLGRVGHSTIVMDGNIIVTFGGTYNFNYNCYLGNYSYVTNYYMNGEILNYNTASQTNTSDIPYSSYVAGIGFQLLKLTDNRILMAPIYDVDNSFLAIYKL